MWRYGKGDNADVYTPRRQLSRVGHSQFPLTTKGLALIADEDDSCGAEMSRCEQAGEESRIEAGELSGLASARARTGALPSLYSTLVHSEAGPDMKHGDE